MMNRLLLLLGTFLVFGCTESASVTPEMPDEMNTTNTKTDSVANYSTQKLLLEGSFKSNVHSTSGTAKIYEDKDGKKTLVFENFKTDAGPDLRIYLANDQAVANFTQISSVVENGNKSYTLPTTVDLKQQKFVLIWCKQFSVLFGHAELK